MTTSISTSSAPLRPAGRPDVPAVAIAAANPVVHLALLSDRIADLWRRRNRAGAPDA